MSIKKDNESITNDDNESINNDDNGSIDRYERTCAEIESDLSKAYKNFKENIKSRFKGNDICAKVNLTYDYLWFCRDIITSFIPEARICDEFHRLSSFIVLILMDKECGNVQGACRKRIQADRLLKKILRYYGNLIKAYPKYSKLLNYSRKKMVEMYKRFTE